MAMKAIRLLLPLCVASAALLRAEDLDLTLPELTVYSPRVANQNPVATFAMPVSALRFEPRVDIHSRNFAEGQADITIRGGIFENSGFKVGGLTLFDPQTGHYFAELPIAPAMLVAPNVLTGFENAIGGTNATVGTIAHGWRPIRTSGFAAVGLGEYQLAQGEIYQGFRSERAGGGYRLAGDVAYAYSESDGSVPGGDHQLERVNARLQLQGERSQTDLFVGLQEKFFSWPNLYTPFGYPETEDIETLLVALNHRIDYGAGDFLQFGAYHRRNRDEYRIPAFSYLANHETTVEGASIEARRGLGEFVLNVRGEILADELWSTTLLSQPNTYRSRTMAKVAVVPEKTFSLRDGARLVAKAGASYDDSNRAGSALSPVAEIAWERHAASLQRVYLSYAESTQLPTYTALNSAPDGLFGGNSRLGRTTSHNVELGARFALENWTTEAAVFFRRDDDLVDWTYQFALPRARTASAVDIDTTGFELVARRAVGRAEIVLGYTALAKSADYGAATVDASFYALNYARHRFTAALIVRISDEWLLRIDNVARIQEENFLRTIGGDEAITSALGLAYRPRAMRGLEVSVQADNLWDTDFQDVPAVPAPRRQISGRVSYAW